MSWCRHGNTYYNAWYTKFSWTTHPLHLPSLITLPHKHNISWNSEMQVMRGQQMNRPIHIMYRWLKISIKSSDHHFIEHMVDHGWPPWCQGETIPAELGQCHGNWPNVMGWTTDCLVVRSSPSQPETPVSRARFIHSWFVFVPGPFDHTWYKRGIKEQAFLLLMSLVHYQQWYQYR